MKKFKRIFAAMLACMLALCILTGCAGTTGGSGGTSVSGSYQQQVLQLVNKERAKYGLNPLTMANENLSAAAQARAKEITQVFSHTRPNGSDCFTALREYGVSGYYTAGENIAAGQRTPAEVVDDWMHSSGHRANILNSNYTQLGVGYVNGYWVQLFIG